jgi:peptide subunit release factor 1 (eRF1)
MQIGVDAENQRQERLVEHILTSAAKGNSAVIGMADVFDAVNNDRVKTLVIEEGLGQPGYVCDHCGALFTALSEICPVCETGKVEKTHDAIEMAVGRVMRGGGDIEFLRADPDFTKGGAIGALLRY